MARKRTPPKDAPVEGPPAQEQVKSRDARAALDRVLDSIPDLDDKWRALVIEAFEAQKPREVWATFTCKNTKCGKKQKHAVVVQIPDFNARAKLLDILLNQAKGKPAETKRVDLTARVAQNRRELEQMTDEQLLELATAEEAGDDA